SDRFAAFVPISGPANTELADHLAKTPAWVFASKEDPIVPCDNSTQMCHAIESFGGHPRLTEFDGNEHDCWLMAIDNSNLIDWMLAQERNQFRANRPAGKLRSWLDP